MHTIFQCAERWELVDKNQIKLVRVKGGTKRLETPRVLAPPYRTMVLIAGCLGLRVSEIVALQWRDFDFPGGTLLILRSVVHGRVGDVKTEYSGDCVPLDAVVVEALMLHKTQCVPTPEVWLFANPATDRPVEMVLKGSKPEEKPAIFGFWELRGVWDTLRNPRN